MAALTADFDENGVVGTADLGAWAAGFGIGAGASPGDGDATGEGAVNGGDFLAWQREYGNGKAFAPPSVVPEPHSAALALIAVAVVAGAARQRHPVAHGGAMGDLGCF
ncbi:MAG: hypothetical protein KDA44_00120 [Planctomycetales bacterium]|nr:hypothetical protein [Planctomycetales bacterium]